MIPRKHPNASNPHPRTSPIPPFWKKSPGYRLPRAQITSSHSSPSRSVPFVSKKSPVPARGVGEPGRAGFLDGFCLPNREVQNFETRPWKINGFPKLILKGSLSPSGEKGYEDISMPTRQDVTQVLQQLECKIPSFQNGLVFWNGPVRIDPNGKFHLVTTHPSRCTNLSISNVMMPEGTTPLQWKHP